MNEPATPTPSRSALVWGSMASPWGSIPLGRAKHLSQTALPGCTAPSPCAAQHQHQHPHPASSRALRGAVPRSEHAAAAPFIKAARRGAGCAAGGRCRRRAGLARGPGSPRGAARPQEAAAREPMGARGCYRAGRADLGRGSPSPADTKGTGRAAPPEPPPGRPRSPRWQHRGGGGGVPHLPEPGGGVARPSRRDCPDSACLSRRARSGALGALPAARPAAEPRILGCGMRAAGCGMRDARCGMRAAGCAMRPLPPLSPPAASDGASFLPSLARCLPGAPLPAAPARCRRRRARPQLSHDVIPPPPLRAAALRGPAAGARIPGVPLPAVMPRRAAQREATRAPQKTPLLVRAPPDKKEKELL